jgi:hypothetical protein
MIGSYILALVVVTIGAIYRPFSRFWLGLLLVLVSSFLISAVLLIFASMLVLSRELASAVGGRLSAARVSKPAVGTRGFVASEGSGGIWDPWLDGI